MTALNHLVLLKLRDDAPTEEVDSALEALRELRDEVEGVLELSVGRDVSVEGLANGFTHGLVVRFADEKARERYLPHPAHQAALKKVEPLLEGIAVVDVAA